MIDLNFTFPPTSITARLQTWRWLLPLTLFCVVIIYEIMEHILAIEALQTASLGWELLLFGLGGPVAVGFVLNWVAGQVQAREEAETQLQQLVRQLQQTEEEVRRANMVLEQNVAERTKSLLEAYQKVAEQNEALQVLDQLKSEFVSLVSHELRTPLTNINGGLELILAFADELDPDTRDSLQVMERESARLTRLVEDILNVSALEAGQLRLNLGPVTLPPLIERLMQGYRLGSPDHRFRVDIQDGLPPALADETCLYEILYNLIDNAVKYTRPSSGAEITVAGGCNRATGQKKGGLIWISVIDNGPGISPAEQAKIFDPFHRLDGRENQEVYGHGLGLYFVRKLVEAQQGKIWVESTPGRGSRFTLVLPLAPATGSDERSVNEANSFID